MIKIEGLQEKPWYIQLALFGLVGLLVCTGFWYFVTSGTRAETAQVQGDIDNLLADNAKAQAAEQRLNEFRASYQRVQSEYEDLKALLPEHKELTMILSNIQDRAGSQLSLRKFAPKTDEQQDWYSSKMIEVGVSGNYNKLGTFFSQLASYQRIVSITDFKLTGMDLKKADDKEQFARGRTVNAEFKLKAYYASPENVQKAAPAAPAAGAPAPAAGAPAPAAAPATN